MKTPGTESKQYMPHKVTREMEIADRLTKAFKPEGTLAATITPDEADIIIKALETMG